MNINVNKHSSIRIGDIYVDPFKIDEFKGDAKCIFITHSHYDHLSFEDIDKVINDETILVGPEDVVYKLRERYSNDCLIVNPGNVYNVDDISFETFSSYNINKPFHPLSNGWVGYVINVNNVKYAILGDTDLTEEVKNIKCDVLFVPIGGTYTMNAKEASEVTNYIKPKLVIPVHYNDVVGNKNDEKEFLEGITGVNFKLFL